MNVEDADILRAERDASPSRFGLFSSDDAFFKRYQQLTGPEKDLLSAQAEGKIRPAKDAEVESISTASSSSASTSSVELEPIRTARMSRTETRRINRSETHPDAISRIETHRTQHSGTVGAGVQSRTTRTKTQRPLPEMGAGKPYPPDLPDREEFVVEFSGADDPMHSQNWKVSKKLYISMILAFDALS